MTLPTSVLYGQVQWQAIAAIADGGDFDAFPDAVPVTGDVTFTPSVTVLQSAGGDSPVTVFATSVTYALASDGILRDSQGRSTVTLLATDAPGLTPVGWTWTVSYRLNGGRSRGSFAFSLPGGSLVDLTTIAPVSSSAGTPVIQGPPGPAGPAGPQGPAGANGTGSGSVSPDATTTVKGLVRLAGDLGGTALNPTVPALTSKANASDLTALSQTVAGKANASDLTTLSTTVVGKANASDLQTLATAVGQKVNTNALATVALSGSYTDLTNKPTVDTTGLVPKAGTGSVRIWPANTVFPTTGVQEGDLFPYIGT